MKLLDIQDLRIELPGPAGPIPVIDSLLLGLEAGKTLGLVGESGSGKSLTALSVARLIPSASYPKGRILLNGEDVLRMPAPALRKLRGQTVSYVFQEPGASLNPLFRVGHQLREVLALHSPQAATQAEAVSLLNLVGIPAPESRFLNYPHELSGGMQQRLALALALAAHPQLLIADEPTTALDVTVQAQIIELLKDLRRKLSMAILLITHNLGVVKDLADQVAVIYAGQIVEMAETTALLSNPLHPYTRALLNSMPSLVSNAERLSPIPGQVPQAGDWPSGCRFHPRCAQAKPECSRDGPALQEIEPRRWVRCPIVDPFAVRLQASERVS